MLEHAGVREGDVLLDVGCGDGLIAFAALERVGPSGRVIFSDVSRDLLDHARSLAAELGVAARCTFVETAAERLGPIEDACIDVVTTRSVLIYVKDKAAAFRQFQRVLRPGGRISLFEPINRFGEGPEGEFAGVDMTPVLAEHRKVRAVYERSQPPDDPMRDFDERDLLELCEGAGFREIRLEYRASIAPPARPPSWDHLLRSAGNPKIPSLDEAMRAVLSPQETERFTSYLRPRYESGARRDRRALAYLWATK